MLKKNYIGFKKLRARCAASMYGHSIALRRFDQAATASDRAQHWNRDGTWKYRAIAGALDGLRHSSLGTKQGRVLFVTDDFNHCIRLLLTLP